MAVLFHGKRGHRTAAACDTYERLEQIILGLRDRPALWRFNGDFLGHPSPDQVDNLGKGKSIDGKVQLRRTHPRLKEGEGLSFTVPFTVVQALKETGALETKKPVYDLLEANAYRTMEHLNKFAFGRTTGGKLVKVDLHGLFYFGYSTRAGQFCPEVKVFVLSTGRAADGRHLAVHWPPLFRAQRSAQAFFHMGLAHDLGRQFGIKCVPHRNSFRTLGVDPKVKPSRAEQIKKETKATGARGPEAKAKAAQRTRGKKTRATFEETVRKTPSRRVGDIIGRTITKLDKAKQRRFAKKCIAAAFLHCGRNATEFRRADVFAAASQLALPHVRPKLFEKVFDREFRRVKQYGATKAKEYADGNVILTSLYHSNREKKAIAYLAERSKRKGGGLTPEQVVKALAARGYSRAELSNIGKLAERKSVTFDTKKLAQDGKTLDGLVDAYKRSGKKVHLVGKSLGKNAYTPAEFVDQVTRTPHLVALWRGLRSPGCLMDRLRVAGQIRNAKPGRLSRGALVITDCAKPTEVQRMAEEVWKAGGKLVVVGEGAKVLGAKVAKHQKALSVGMKI